MIVYKFRESDRVYAGTVELPDGPTIPPYHTFQAPPEKAGHYAVMQNGWVLIEGETPAEPPPPPQPDPKEVYNAQQKKNRAAAYAAESDPIFFKAQRGEATMEEWNAKVLEIQERYPYQE